MKKKPPAADRTIDLFSGKTHIEELTDTLSVAVEDAEERTKSAETIEESADRWRASAIFTSELLSQNYGKEIPEKEVFRLTEKDSILYLEKLTNDRVGKAYAYTGVMFRSDSLYELANLFYKAAKERQRSEAERKSKETNYE